MKDAIVLEGVTRSFGRKAVLRGVTARASAGKVVGLLGRNGEGKTTLIQILLDLLAADGGRVEVLGRTPDGSGELRQLVGFVPERPSFHSFMSAGEVLDWRARFFRRFSKERALSLSSRLSLDLSTRIEGASKGTLGKLAWVCAAAHDPELYVLDEPTSGLDALVRDEVLAGLIDELQESGRTVLVSNHHMEEFAGLLDEVWVLAEGRIAAVHDAEVLRTQACRVRGRLKEGAALPAGLRVGAGGPLVDVACFDAGAAERVAAAGALESFERAPLPMNEVFKLLLKEVSPC